MLTAAHLAAAGGHAAAFEAMLFPLSSSEVESILGMAVAPGYSGIYSDGLVSGLRLPRFGIWFRGFIR